MVKKSSGHDFIWKHKEKEKETTLMFPIKIYKTTDKNWRPDTHLVCNKCESSVSQKYVCDKCNEKYTIGQIEKRHDTENNVIYNNSQKKQFMETEIIQHIKVENEIPLSDVLPNILFVKKAHEIYNNADEYKDVVKKIYSYLQKKQIALVASFGKSQKWRSGIIIATDRLIMLEIRDYRLIRHIKQTNIESEENPSTEILKAISETQEPELYNKFIDKIKNGEKIKIEPRLKTEKKAIVKADFLEM